jgi:6-phosphogluconolactonase
VILTRFDDAAAAAAALAEEVAGALRAGIAERGVGSLAVAGGRTPVALFRALRESALDWSSVQVTLTDERWIPEPHPASNAALVRRELLTGTAAAARFTPLHTTGSGAAAAAVAIWESLATLSWPLDAVVLGMGEDGHFASLFAGNPALDEALDPQAAPACVAMRAPVEPRERLSLNLAALVQTRRLFLLVSGSAKRELLLRASRRELVPEPPVSALLALRHPQSEVYWSP